MTARQPSFASPSRRTRAAPTAALACSRAGPCSVRWPQRDEDLPAHACGCPRRLAHLTDAAGLRAPEDEGRGLRARHGGRENERPAFGGGRHRRFVEHERVAAGTAPGATATCAMAWTAGSRSSRDPRRQRAHEDLLGRQALVSGEGDAQQLQRDAPDRRACRGRRGHRARDPAQRRAGPARRGPGHRPDAAAGARRRDRRARGPDPRLRRRSPRSGRARRRRPVRTRRRRRGPARRAPARSSPDGHTGVGPPPPRRSSWRSSARPRWLPAGMPSIDGRPYGALAAARPGGVERRAPSTRTAAVGRLGRACARAESSRPAGTATRTRSAPAAMARRPRSARASSSAWASVTPNQGWAIRRAAPGVRGARSGWRRSGPPPRRRAERPRPRRTGAAGRVVHERRPPGRGRRRRMRRRARGPAASGRTRAGPRQTAAGCPRQGARCSSRCTDRRPPRPADGPGRRRRRRRTAAGSRVPGRRSSRRRPARPTRRQGVSASSSRRSSLRRAALSGSSRCGRFGAGRFADPDVAVGEALGLPDRRAAPSSRRSRSWRRRMPRRGAASTATMAMLDLAERHLADRDARSRAASTPKRSSISSAISASIRSAIDSCASYSSDSTSRPAWRAASASWPGAGVPGVTRVRPRNADDRAVVGGREAIGRARRGSSVPKGASRSSRIRGRPIVDGLGLGAPPLTGGMQASSSPSARASSASA